MYNKEKGENYEKIVLLATGILLMFAMVGCGNDSSTNIPPSPSITSPQETEYNLTLSSNNSAYGSVYGGGEFNKGTVVNIYASAKEDYFFSHWSDGSVENPRQITLNSNVDLTANFVAGQGETIIVNGHKLTIVNGYAKKTSTGYTISAYEQGSFSYWSQDDEDSEILSRQASFDITSISTDKTYKAHHSNVGFVVLTVSSSNEAILSTLKTEQDFLYNMNNNKIVSYYANNFGQTVTFSSEAIKNEVTVGDENIIWNNVTLHYAQNGTTTYQCYNIFRLQNGTLKVEQGASMSGNLFGFKHAYKTDSKTVNIINISFSRD